MNDVFAIGLFMVGVTVYLFVNEVSFRILQKRMDIASARIDVLSARLGERREMPCDIE